MKQTTAICNLQQVADENKKFCNARKSKAWKLIIAALENKQNTIRPAAYSGRGRFTTVLDYTATVRALLDAAKIKYQSGNDSQRGGVTGNYIILTHIKY